MVLLRRILRYDPQTSRREFLVMSNAEILHFRDYLPTKPAPATALDKPAVIIILPVIRIESMSGMVRVCDPPQWFPL
jgi:hypothetical protein